MSKRKTPKMTAAENYLGEWCLWWAGPDILDEENWIAVLPSKSVAVGLARRWNRGAAKQKGGAS